MNANEDQANGESAAGQLLKQLLDDFLKLLDDSSLRTMPWK